MNPIEERMKILPEYHRDIDILDVCLTLRMSMNGSADREPDEEKYVLFLNKVLETWQENSLNAVQEKAFDECVKNLVMATLNQYDYWNKQYNNKE